MWFNDYPHHTIYMQHAQYTQYRIGSNPFSHFSSFPYSAPPVSITEDFLNETSESMGGREWKWVCGNFLMSDSFMRKHINNLHFGLVSKCQTLTGEFMQEYQHKLHWNQLNFVNFRKLSLELIKKYQNELNWDIIFSINYSFDIPYSLAKEHLTPFYTLTYMYTNLEEVNDALIEQNIHLISYNDIKNFGSCGYEYSSSFKRKYPLFFKTVYSNNIYPIDSYFDYSYFWLNRLNW
jgi:hypothetical protein